MTRRLVTLLALLAAIALPSATLAATTVTNGSFEGTTDVGSSTTLATGSTAINGWTVTAGSVDWVGSYWDSFDGSKSVDLNGTGHGDLSQHLATSVGYDYVVSFYLAGNASCSPMLKTLDVSATGTPASSYSFDATGKLPTDMGWTQKSYSFTATDTDTLLTFSSTTSGSCGPALDMVSLTETAPPPTTTGATKDDCKEGGWQAMTDADGTPFATQGDCVSYYATGTDNAAARPRPR